MIRCPSAGQCCHITASSFHSLGEASIAPLSQIVECTPTAKCTQNMECAQMWIYLMTKYKTLKCHLVSSKV